MDTDISRITRRQFVIGAGATVAALAACGPQPVGIPPATTTRLPTPPKQPITLAILDVAGQKQLTGAAIDEYVRNHGQYVSSYTIDPATAPELPAKLLAQENAGQIVYSMILTGADGLSAGIGQNLLQRILPDFEVKFPDLASNYIEPQAQNLAQGRGILVVYGNYGPTFTYNPTRLAAPPRNTDDLLAWAKANPKQLVYARPANSGPGRSLLQGLPYVLGESSPKDPSSWTKVYDYLAQLGQYIASYPSATGGTFKDLGAGNVTVAASTMGWDMNVRTAAIASVPPGFKTFWFDNETLIADSQYVVLPKGLDNDHLYVALDLMAWLLRPIEQAQTYDNAYFYPGPAVKNVPISMAPQASRAAIESVARPEFEAAIQTLPHQTQLPTDALNTAFSLWDSRVGALKASGGK